MERVPEPELMTEYEQVKAYSEADFSSSDADFVTALELMISCNRAKLGCQSLIVDFGCGPGNITERLSRQWPKARVVGIDGSKEMLRVAKQRKENIKIKEGLKGFSYLQSDLGSISKRTLSNLGLNSVDVLVSNSVLHHIHDPHDFWMANKTIGVPGTIVFHRDLRRPPSFEDAIKIQEKYQAGAPSILNRDFLASLKAAFTLTEVERQLNQLGLFQLKVFEVSDRYLEVRGVF